MSEHYSDEVIDQFVDGIDRNRKLIENNGYSAGNLYAITAIIRQLRAERDEARRAAESMRAEVEDCGRPAGKLAMRVLEYRDTEPPAVGTESRMFATDEAEYFGLCRESENE